MGEEPLTTLEVRGKKVEIFVRVEAPVRYDRKAIPKTKFFANLGGSRYEEDSLGDLHSALLRAAKAATVKVEVEFTSVRMPYRHDSPEVEPGTPIFSDEVATGIHGSNRNILVRTENGRSEQRGHYGGEKTFRRLSADEKETLRALHREKERVLREIARLEEEWSIELRKEVEASIEEAAAARDGGAS